MTLRIYDASIDEYREFTRLDAVDLMRDILRLHSLRIITDEGDMVDFFSGCKAWLDIISSDELKEFLASASPHLFAKAEDFLG